MVPVQIVSGGTSFGFALTVLCLWPCWQGRPTDRRNAGFEEQVDELGPEPHPDAPIASLTRCASLSVLLS